MKRYFFMFILVTFLAGCNTVRGVGEDVDAAGNSIQRAAGEPSAKSAD